MVNNVFDSENNTISEHVIYYEKEEKKNLFWIKTNLTSFRYENGRAKRINTIRNVYRN